MCPSLSINTIITSTNSSWGIQCPQKKVTPYIRIPSGKRSFSLGPFLVNPAKWIARLIPTSLIFEIPGFLSCRFSHGQSLVVHKSGPLLLVGWWLSIYSNKKHPGWISTPFRCRPGRLRHFRSPASRRLIQWMAIGCDREIPVKTVDIFWLPYGLIIIFAWNLPICRGVKTLGVGWYPFLEPYKGTPHDISHASYPQLIIQFSK